MRETEDREKTMNNQLSVDTRKMHTRSLHPGKGVEARVQ